MHAPQSVKPVKSSVKRKLTPDHAQTDKLDSSVKAAPPPSTSPAALDIWGGEADAAATRKRRKAGRFVGTMIQPVEVDKPGSSYNPDPDQHEEALAEAEAAEVTKANKPLLQATAPPRSLPICLGAEDDELALLQVHSLRSI